MLQGHGSGGTGWGHGWSGPPAFLGALANPPRKDPAPGTIYTGMLPQYCHLRGFVVILGSLFLPRADDYLSTRCTHTPVSFLE